MPNSSSSGEKSEEISLRWIDTIKNCVTQQTEQRRGLYPLKQTNEKYQTCMCV